MSRASLLHSRLGSTTNRSVFIILRQSLCAVNIISHPRHLTWCVGISFSCLKKFFCRMSRSVWSIDGRFKYGSFFPQSGPLWPHACVQFTTRKELGLVKGCIPPALTSMYYEFFSEYKYHNHSDVGAPFSA